MGTVRRAVIDVGTNSVKLLVADVRGGVVTPVHEESSQTRLGRGLYQTQRLQPEPIARTAEAVRKFAALARERNAATLRVIATSAAREALNRNELVSAIARAAGLNVEIISGEQEADWAFRGVATDAALARRPLLLLDVGGGSTQLILGRNGVKHFVGSFPLGAVRLMEQFPPGDPPSTVQFKKCRDWLEQFLRGEIRPQLEPALKQESGPLCLVGTGGTATILARMELKLDRYDRERIERTVLRLSRVSAWRRQLWKLPLEKRREIPGLPKNRADVILTGVLIYETMMREFGFEQLRVSTRGLRFAVVSE
jgi:exopolyphosphatase/guanosine-5'-triphosphate,3'-diphosphate pyrophosphatase